MPREMSGNSSSVLWRGKPWILPGLMVRSIVVVAVVVIVSWLELQLDVAAKTLLIMPLALWTGLAIFLIWVLSVAHLLLVRVSSTYLLRNDGLEVRTGVFSSKSFVIAPAGFSDLEVTRSVSARIVNSGSITIRTQGETSIMMERVRDALRVADQIRGVMARPIVRIEGQNVVTEKK